MGDKVAVAGAVAGREIEARRRDEKRFYHRAHREHRAFSRLRTLRIIKNYELRERTVAVAGRDCSHKLHELTQRKEKKPGVRRRETVAVAVAGRD